MVRLAVLLMLLCAGGALAATGQVLASGVGVDLIQNQTDRLAHPDVADSVDSTVLRDRIFAFWHHEWDDERRLNLDLEQEDYALQATEGDRLIDLTLTKLHPRYRIKRDLWALDTALLAIDVQRNDAVFAPVDQDHKDGFVLPALVGDLTPRPWLFRGGYWEEYEILPLEQNRYAITLARLFLLGVGYAFSEDAEARLEVNETRRFYPDTFTLDRTDTIASYRLQDPLDAGDAPLWREASAQVAQKHYPGTGESFAELTLGSVLRFTTEPVTHFLVPELVLADSYVVYRRDTQPKAVTVNGTQVENRSLLEETVNESDATLRVKYEGFMHVGEGPFVLAWGAMLESSLIQGVQRAYIVHLKGEYTY